MPYRDRKIIARFRFGNKCKTKEYWRKEEDKNFRLCKVGEEDHLHVLMTCEIMRNEGRIEKILSQDVKEIEILNRVVMEKKGSQEGLGEEL
ncbi:hypothetical protein M0804_014777 [Polistes exclamans]|nr:hypothetical protein M0804_014777 [Polistes exclamans]